jgi:hypothetical protein
MRLRLLVLLRRDKAAVGGVDGVFLEDMLDSWMCVDVEKLVVIFGIVLRIWRGEEDGFMCVRDLGGSEEDV